MDKWISVKDRLPQDNTDGLDDFCDDVLIMYNTICIRCRACSGSSKIYIGYYFDGWKLAQPLDTDVFGEEHNEQIEVTHWMPLPEPPNDL